MSEAGETPLFVAALCDDRPEGNDLREFVSAQPAWEHLSSLGPHEMLVASGIWPNRPLDDDAALARTYAWLSGIGTGYLVDVGMFA